MPSILDVARRNERLYSRPLFMPCRWGIDHERFADRSRRTARLLAGFASSALAAVAPDFMAKLTAESRPLEDRVRDGARRPYQVMQLLGVNAGQTLLDVGAGGGWFTRVLSAATGSSGKVIAQFGPRALQTRERQGAERPRSTARQHRSVLRQCRRTPGQQRRRCRHGAQHAPHERRARRPVSQGDSHRAEAGRPCSDHRPRRCPQRRTTPAAPHAAVRRETWIQQAGFEIVTESDILRTTADDHTLSAEDPILGRDVDQFIFIVRKPQR